MIYDKYLTASLTGHRPRKLPWHYDETKENCIRFKKDLKIIFEGAIRFGLKTFLTGMAEGFDMIATEILMELRKENPIKIIAVIPCLGQEKNWSISQQRRYKKIIRNCNDLIILNKHYTSTCMNERNKFMVKHSSVVIACYNGNPSGTGNALKFAKESGCKIKIINPCNYK